MYKLIFFDCKCEVCGSVFISGEQETMCHVCQKNLNKFSCDKKTNSK